MRIPISIEIFKAGEGRSIFKRSFFLQIFLLLYPVALYAFCDLLLQGKKNTSPNTLLNEHVEIIICYVIIPQMKVTQLYMYLLSIFQLFLQYVQQHLKVLLYFSFKGVEVKVTFYLYHTLLRKYVDTEIPKGLKWLL